MGHIRSLIPVTAFLVLFSAAGSAAQTLTADEKELSTYRLTMPTLKKVMSALGRFMEELEKDPKVQEQKKLEAQIKALEAKEELTDAQAAELEKLHQRADALEEEMDRMQEATGMNDPKTIDEMEAAIKRHPGFLQALTREGLTPREYSKTMLALLQASLAEGFSQGKLDPKNLPAGINPENLKFVRENKDALAAMQAELNKKK